MFLTGIYQIKNKLDNKIYIGSGSSINNTKAVSGIYTRLADHHKRLRADQHINKYLQNAWNKYGEENFEFEILELCSAEKCLEREQYWLDKKQCYDKEIGYNLCKITGNTLGKKHSEEAKLKMSKNRIGKYPYSPELKLFHSKRMSGVNHGGYGKHHSEETRKRMGLKNKIKVNQLSLEGHLINQWDSITEAGKILSIDPSGIIRCCKGNAKTAKNYKWEYGEDRNSF